MRQGVAPLVGLTTYVSIHASVKDATINYSKRGTTTRVSIHASVKDATLGMYQMIPICRVSIHASVKDATLCFLLYKIVFRVFQSTHL